MLEEVDWQTAAFVYMLTLSHVMEDWKEHKVFPSAGHDTLIQFPPRLRLLCSWWLCQCRPDYSPWTSPPHSLTITADASDLGWDYQSFLGHQGSGRWGSRTRRWNINIKEFSSNSVETTSILFRSVRILSDNTTVVHCINRQGLICSLQSVGGTSPRPPTFDLPRVSEQRPCPSIFIGGVASHAIPLCAFHTPLRNTPNLSFRGERECQVPVTSCTTFRLVREVPTRLRRTGPSGVTSTSSLLH